MWIKCDNGDLFNTDKVVRFSAAQIAFGEPAEAPFSVVARLDTGEWCRIVDIGYPEFGHLTKRQIEVGQRMLAKVYSALDGGYRAFDAHAALFDVERDTPRDYEPTEPAVE